MLTSSQWSMNFSRTPLGSKTLSGSSKWPTRYYYSTVFVVVVFSFRSCLPVFLASNLACFFSLRSCLFLASDLVCFLSFRSYLLFSLRFYLFYGFRSCMFFSLFFSFRSCLFFSFRSCLFFSLKFCLFFSFRSCLLFSLRSCHILLSIPGATGDHCSTDPRLFSTAGSVLSC